MGERVTPESSVIDVSDWRLIEIIADNRSQLLVSIAHHRRLNRQTVQ